MYIGIACGINITGGFEMKLKSALIITGLFFVNSYSSVGWQTTRNGYSSGSCQIQSNKLRVIIHPFFAEVEEEAEIAPQGGVWSGDSKTLEIVDEFDLPTTTAIQSMLLWNGEKILKAKLKMKGDASKQYEDVVDREKIVPPRDPALIEQISDGRYRCRIYPVAIDGKRKLRVKYIVPISMETPTPQFPIKTIFTMDAYNQLRQIPLIVETENESGNKCVLKTKSASKSIAYNSVYLLSPSEITDSYTWYGAKASYLSIIPDKSTWNCSWSENVSDGPAKGYYSAIIMTVPDSIKSLVNEQLSPNEIQLEMGVTVGKSIYLTDVKNSGFQAMYCKSDTEWDGTVYWNGYNADGDKVFNCKQTATPVKKELSNGMLPLLWGLKYSQYEKKDALGALYGYVDSKMSLLTLESDTLGRDLSAIYNEKGVPSLLPEEIIVDSKKLPATPKESIIFEIGTGTLAHAHKVENLFDVVCNDMELKIVLNNKLGNVRVNMLDLSGRIIQQWTAEQLPSNNILIKMNRRYSGTFIIQIQHGARILQKKVVLR
jgi:hypothetical protein